ncbi:WD domain, G-beta repeat protein (macronuclear) [Tetrahymena thermophila SB210]|uniref:non-specific serine/threonine protein kinase n=1 Tax=Tetrahymena thermophila (strain SB210) TaxID=312017 RepID=A4VEX7_TETTS|nr:WD domain, G-beta repeat protein [Tetrahymena thermophila SB210]EDK32081.2 WD domain, G-beta repeat protein [Tetrahymena thermophila SB210]|eukprot:XP_001470707.2 WD domain, G-beta repeat protein [Tetrahymena thermophila SB210]
MGNTLLEATDKYPLKQFDLWSEEKPELSGSKLLFESKIFHTMSFNLKNQNSSIIMKVYLKENDFDQRNSKMYKEQFEYIKKKFTPIYYPNVLPFMTLLHFDQYQASQVQQQPQSYNFVVVARQMMYLTLSERFLYKPSLSSFEKNWILFQTLIAIYCVHKLENIFHGAIRSSNILLTTSNHAFLTDFANYKPLYIDEANQIRDLRFFYKTHENNSTLAPEKFKNNVEQQLIALDQIAPKLLKDLQSMDIFSLGCVISDLYFEGDQPLFTYEQVQKFKAKQYTPESIIKKIQCQKTQQLVHKIIMEENEENRIGIEEVLKYFINEIIQDKEKFMLLYCLDTTIQSNLLAKPDYRIAFLKEMLPIIHQVCIQQESKEFIDNLQQNFKYSLPLSLQKINFRKQIVDAVQNLKFKIWEILELEMPYYLKHENIQQKQLEYENTENLKEKQFKTCWQNYENNAQKLQENLQNGNQEQDIQQNNKQQKQQQQVNNTQSPELKQIIMLLCTNLRTVQYSASKLVGLEMLVHLSTYLSDYDVLHAVLPFICDSLEDSDIQVAEYALEAFAKLLSRLHDPFDSLNDTTLYKVFIWSNFQKCAKIMDIHRVFLLNCIDLAQSCIRLCNISIKKRQKFLEEQMNQSIIVDNQSRAQSMIRNQQEEIISPEKLESEIIDLVKNVFKKCLSYDSPSDRSNLAISQLSRFLEFLKEDLEKMNFLQIFISCLNKTERKLSCLENMYDIITKIQDPRSKQFAIICLKECLKDQNELFEYTAVNCSWRLVEKGILDKAQILEFLDYIIPLILHPHNWIRKEAIKFVEVVITKMDPIQVFLEIQPKIKDYLTEEVAIINKDILKLILPKKIDKKYVDYKNKKCVFTDKLGEQEVRKNIDLFQNNYLSRITSSSKELVKNLKDEEIKQFAIKFEIAKYRQDYRQNFSKRLSDFLISAFKQNFLYFSNMVDMKYRQFQGQDDKQTEKLMLDYFREKKINFDSSNSCFEINNELQKFLSQLQIELAFKYDQLMIDYSLYGNHNHKNFANSLININEFLLKLQQFDVQEETDVGKPFFYDPAANSNTNSLKIWHPQGQLVTTIYEHSDVISNLESLGNNRHFMSASYDGTVRVFDVQNLEQDFTSDSIAQIICKDNKDNATNRNHKIKVIKTIPNSSSVLIGTEKGSIYLYNIEQCTNTQLNLNLRKRNLQTIYCQGEIRCLESFEKCFLYATSKGEIGVRDIRTNSVALCNNIGKERGLISSMVLASGFQSEQNSTVAIGTLNGYCLLYDIRCNLLSHNYQLLNHNEEPLPIMSLSNFNRYVNVDILGDQKDLLAMSYVSDNHEVAMFNLNEQMVDNIKPAVYMLSTDNYNPIIHNPMLKSINKQENFKNCNKNTLKDMMDYDFIPKFSEQVDVLSYLKDPLMTNQNNIKMKWLEQSNNCFQNIKKIQDCKNYVSKIICLPSYSSQSYQTIPKAVQNQIITCGNDRNIRLWPMVSDPPSKSNTQLDTQIKGFHISNVDDCQRNFSQKKVADVLTLHEYSRTSFQQSTVYQQNVKKKSQIEEYNYPTFSQNDKRSCHYDTITDMMYLERDQGALLITGSRDKTIKIWK